MQDAIKIKRTLAIDLLALAQASPNAEICGLVSSIDGKPVRIYPVNNVAGNPACHFDMDPQQQIDALRMIREQNETLFAIYHSHPTAPAVPSTEDVHQWAYSEALGLIISLSIKGVLEMRAYEFADQTYTERSLIL